MAKIPVISLWRPWADWVALGWKSIETRTHERFAKLQYSIIGIHATSYWDKTAISQAWRYLTAEQIAYTNSLQKESFGSKILCLVPVQRYYALDKTASKDALIDCDPAHVQRYGLVFGKPFRLNPIIPAKGKQGIWYIDSGLFSTQTLEFLNRYK